MRVFIKLNFLFIFTLCAATAHAARAAKEADCAPEIVPQTIERLVIDLNPMNMNCWDKSNYSVVGDDDKSRLDEQKNICTCLYTHRNPDISTEMMLYDAQEKTRAAINESLRSQPGMRAITGSEENIVRNFTTSVGRVQRNLREQMDGMLFQSSVISNNVDFIAEFNNKSELGNIMRTVQAKFPLMRQAVVAQAKAKFSAENTSGGWLENRRDKKEIENRVVAALNDMAIPEKPTEGLFDNRIDANKCVSAADFLAYKQAPTEKALNDFISNNSFKEEDWDYDRLRLELYRLTARPLHEKRADADKINSVKARMRFLRMNPMMMNLFKAHRSNDRFFNFANLSAGEREVWDKHPGWEQLPRLKEGLFGILKNVASGSKCDAQKNTCLVDSTQSNKISDYRTSLEKFFSDPNAKSMTMMEASKASFMEVEGLTGDRAFDYPDKMKSVSRVNELFATRFSGFTQPSECLNSSNPDFRSCAKTYFNYCKQIDIASNNLSEDLSSNENLGMELGLPENIFNPDLQTNREYNEFNDKICNQERMSQPAGRFSTFSKFKDEFCRTHRNDPGCVSAATPAGISAIRTKFLEQYPAQRGEDPEAVAMEVRAFNEYVKKNAVESIPQDQIANVVQRSSSATRPSERFMEYSNSIRGGESTAASTPSIIKQSGAVSSSRTTVSSGLNEVSSIQSDLSQGFFQPANIVTPQASFLSNVSSQNVTSEDDREKIRSLAEEEIARVRKESATSIDQSQKDALESRVKTMEQLLAQKAENELKYQQLIEQLNKKLDSGITSPTAIANQSSPEENKKARVQAQVNQSSFAVDHDNQNRAPASVNENINSTYGATGTSGGMASLGGSSGTKAMSGGRGASSFNSALLEAQESKAGKVQKSADGSIIVASDANSPSLQAMGSAANAVSDYSLSVPAADYAGFEAQNMETLKRYQEKLLTSMESNQPVRVFVKAANKEPLEFFVVKDGERLFFKPVRKTGATLEALKEVVKKKP